MEALQLKNDKARLESLFLNNFFKLENIATSGFDNQSKKIGRLERHLSNLANKQAKLEMVVKNSLKLQSTKQAKTIARLEANIARQLAPINLFMEWKSVVASFIMVLLSAWIPNAIRFLIGN